MHDSDQLSQRLQFAESDFLTALESGTTVLSSYHRAWSTLPDILHTASKTESFGHETLSLAYSVASRIANIASCFLDIRRGEESYAASLQSDCDIMFHQMAALDLNTNSKSSQPDKTRNGTPSHSHSSTPVPSAESSSPPFLASAYQWLVDNLHNPYPTAEVKAQIAAASSCKVSSINSWFINARRRIGWTTLCREHFSNCRADMIDAAYRALVEEDPQRTLSPELRHSFVAMKVAAEALYSTIFTKSAFARDLDAIVKGVMDKDRESVDIGICCHNEQAKLTKTIRDSYPSPDRSSTTSPLPALDDSQMGVGEEEEDAAPPIIAGSKRRRSSMEPPDQPSSTTSRPTKRLRVAMTQTYLPSPPSSTNGNDSLSDHGSPELSTTVHSTQFETSQVFPPHRRCVSDVDATVMSIRLHGSMAASRPQVVSDPLPCSHMGSEYSMDDWFSTNFDTLFTIPPPVDATEPDFSVPWEVELFRDYNIPGNPKYSSFASTLDTQLSAPTSQCDLDSLLRFIGGDASVAPPGTVPSSDITRLPNTASFDPLIPDISQTDVDWTSLLDATATYQPTIDSTFFQYHSESRPLPEIDLSMLQLPHVVHAADSEGDFTSKQVKLQRLHAMQEQVRRMEQELQSEGIVI